MTVVGHQEFWITGSRFYFYPDEVIDGQDMPFVDFGRIDPANPGLDIETAELEDSDGGIRSTVSEETTKINENYEITTSNMNQETWEYLFIAEPSAEFSQAAETKAVQHYVKPNSLCKLHDNDTSRTFLYGFTSISGVTDTDPASTLSSEAPTAIVAATRTISIAGLQTAGALAGDSVILSGAGLEDPLNAGTYTLQSLTDTEIVVVESLASDQATITAGLLYYNNNGADTGTIYAFDTDWEVHQLSRGIVAIQNGTTITEGNVFIVFTLGALTGTRLTTPQSRKGAIKGRGVLVWSQNNYETETVREFECQITPGSVALSDTEYSNATINVKVTSDLASQTPAGRMLKFAGEVTPTYT